MKSKLNCIYLHFKVIKTIKDIWSGINLHFESYKDKGIYYINVNDEIFQTLEDHLVQLSGIKMDKCVVNI